MKSFHGNYQFSAIFHNFNTTLRWLKEFYQNKIFQNLRRKFPWWKINRIPFSGSIFYTGKHSGRKLEIGSKVSPFFFFWNTPFKMEPPLLEDVQLFLQLETLLSIKERVMKNKTGGFLHNFLNTDHHIFTSSSFHLFFLIFN